MTNLHDVDLDACVELAVSDNLRLWDEGGALWEATVVAIEPVRFGRRYRLALHGTADATSVE